MKKILDDGTLICRAQQNTLILALICYAFLVPGIARPGELVAIMGASGAGKTTLLNILNFRNRGKLKIKGDVKLNGKVADWELITRHSGYVQQEDLFMSTLTVKEHLNFMVLVDSFYFHSGLD